MEHQNQILQTLRAPESQARLERIVAQEALNNRAAVGRRVCAEFGFVDAPGSAQLAGCLKALNTLHKAGRIALPASRRGGGAPTPQRFDAPVAAATAVPGTVEAVAGLSLERVEQGGQRRVWNTLLHFEHPQGTTTFPAPRTPDHVARLRTNLHRNPWLPHWTAGACWSCPERIMWVQGRARQLGS